ncbi:MAG: ATP-binding protein [Cohaesibacter sp.]|jgi:signal transduction histidine kinase|nr:ATP-binding protein [Cohaesibacter sp.]
MLKSLSARLIVVASIWAFICILVAGVLIADTFRKSIEQDFDQRLNISVKILVGEFAGKLAQGEPLGTVSNLGEPLFELPLSGWYWTVEESETATILASSVSLASARLSALSSKNIPFNEENSRLGYGEGPDGKAIRILERKIRFGEKKSYLIRVSGNAEEIDNRAQEFQRNAWITMGYVVALPILSIFWVVSFSLRPLHRLQERLRDVRQGEATQITGSYPLEISGLVEEANALITSNRDLTERARMQVGNLAHAMKTPLSVIINEASGLDDKVGERVAKQAQIMTDQVHLYLERARMAAHSNVLGAVTPVKPVLERLTQVMEKIHSHSNLAINLDIASDLHFQGEEHDLEEMVGNLVDNACKWAKSQVRIAVHTLPDRVEENKTRYSFKITIEDDGPGLSQEQRREVKRRGYRLDESKPGSGLGLSIVEELARLHKGSFTLWESDLGGLKVELELPAV